MRPDSVVLWQRARHDKQARLGDWLIRWARRLLAIGSGLRKRAVSTPPRPCYHC